MTVNELKLWALKTSVIESMGGILSQTLINRAKELYNNLAPTHDLPQIKDPVDEEVRNHPDYVEEKTISEF